MKSQLRNYIYAVLLCLLTPAFSLHAQQWITQTSGTTNNLRSVYFVSDTEGWATGLGGIILHTTNGGSTWSAQTSGTVADFYSVFFVSATQGWAVGAGGKIYTTTNAGSTWAAQTSGVSNTMSAVYFKNASYGWIIGSGGKILATTNGGTTWTLQTSNTTNNLSGIFFSSQTKGWAVGLSGLILTTNDGGANWSAQTSGTTNNLISISFTSASNGWATGAGGKILSTTDGGATWTAQTSGTSSTLNTIYFVSATKGWALGSAGLIKTTSNGGTNWATQTSGTTNFIYSSFFRSAILGWAVGENGTIVSLNCVTPDTYSVTGGGSYCAGGNGLPVGLANSQTGVNYTLQKDNVEVTTIAGTGSAISFGNQTAAGTYKVQAKTTVGTCTATMTGSVDITINQPTSSTTNLSICPSQIPYSWNGQLLTTANTYQATLANAAGCDSIATLNLSIKKTSNSEETITRCSAYSWNGNSYGESGDYTFAATNAAGCDSTATLHLFITTEDTLVQNVTICKSIKWNGYTYRKSGVYYYRSSVNGCRLVSILRLTIPVITSTKTVISPICYNEANASIEVGATNGVSPYMYKNGLTGAYQQSGLFTGLRGGVNYRIYIQDANGCEGYTDSLTIPQTPKISATFTTANATCYNTATGAITVTAVNGTAPFVYKNGANGTYQSSNTFTGLRAGTYRMYVQDAKGCTGYTALVNLGQTLPISTTTTQTSTSCANANDATITVDVTNGTAPYMYKNGATGTYQSNNTFTGLRPNKYRIYVQDANGCNGNSNLVTIAQPTPIQATYTSNDAGPFSNNGNITVSATGGTPPYKYKNGVPGTYQSANYFDGLAPNFYRIFIIDSLGCTGFTDRITIDRSGGGCRGCRTVNNQPIVTTKDLDIRFAPNPTTNQFVLTTPFANNEAASISVTDINGRQLYQAKGVAGQSFRFGQTLAPGVYFVQVKVGNDTKTVKAIKLK